MTDTEAAFTIWDDADIVKFIKRHHLDGELQYEVTCACRVLGIRLIRKHKLLSIYKRLSRRTSNKK